MMVLVAALGGSGAVSCPMVDDLDSYGTRIEPSIDVSLSTEASDRDRR
jgi:hypothetical protein